MYNSPPFKFYIFLLIFNAILWGLHYWVFRNLSRTLANTKRFGSKRVKWSLAALFVAVDLPWIFLYIYRTVKGETPNALGWLIMYPFAVAQAVLFFWAIVLAVYGIVRRSAIWSRTIWRHLIPAMRGLKAPLPPPPISPGRRAFLRASSVGLTGYAVAASTLGVIGRDECEINEKEIVIPGLPAAFDGFRIALISDIHSGTFVDKATMSKYAKIVNDLRCDVIVVPGDYVNSLDSEIYPFVEAFSALHAPQGVFGVTGNHDYFANAELVCREAEQAGIKMLRDEHVMIEKNGSRIALLGIDDAQVGRAEPMRYIQTGKSAPVESMLRGVPQDAKKILLCHRPYPFEEFSQMGMDLMLSGHTHGGQISLLNFGGVNLSFAALASRFIQGHYRSRTNPQSQLYVSRGIGTVGLPLRINCPPEVTAVVLRAAT